MISDYTESQIYKPETIVYLATGEFHHERNYLVLVVIDIIDFHRYAYRVMASAHASLYEPVNLRGSNLPNSLSL